MLKKKTLPRAKPIPNVNWSQSPELIAFDIWKLQPNYSVALAKAFNEDIEDYLQEWFMVLHSQVLAVLSSDKYRRTASTICIFSRRKLSNIYRDRHIRYCRFKPERLMLAAQFNATAAKMYTSWQEATLQDDTNEGF